MVGALAIGAFALSLAPKGALGGAWLLWLLAVGALAWVVRQPAGTRRDDALPALAVLLSALGLTTIARLSADLAHRQVIWLALSLALVLALGPAFNRFRRMTAYKYTWVVASIVLFGLLAVFGQEVNGAKLWIRIGPVQYEPVELIKLFIVFFMAAYLAETADVIAAAKPWSLRANARYLGPLFLGWGASMAILVFERDIGMATLLLATFAAMLYVATRRIDLIAGGATVFALAVWWAAHHYAYVAARIAVWRDPFADPYGRGYQALQGLFSLASGGLFGTGYGRGHPVLVPDAAKSSVRSARSSCWPPSR
jgi:cell division protein FtsW (lipid II flippase)